MTRPEELRKMAEAATAGLDGPHALRPSDAEIAQLATDLADALDREAAKDAEIARLQEALIWCSGSQDFQVDGVAREGWLKLCKPLIDCAALVPAPGVDGEE